MKNIRKKVRFHFNLKSKHLLVIMTFFCGQQPPEPLPHHFRKQPVFLSFPLKRGSPVSAIYLEM